MDKFDSFLSNDVHDQVSSFMDDTNYLNSFELDFNNAINCIDKLIIEPISLFLELVNYNEFKFMLKIN